MLGVSQAAIIRIKQILENKDETALRVYIQGGGCSGFQYGFQLESEQEEGDILIENNEVRLVIDPLSMQYLEGAEIDFKDDLMGSRFVVHNPNASTTCGCGASFST